MLGADDLGRGLAEKLRRHLVESGHEVVDPEEPTAEPVDYPDVAQAVARAVAAGRVGRAVLVCGTGIGMAIVANKVPGVRAAAVSDPYSAERARASNDAQVLCLGSQVVGDAVAPMLVDLWLAAEFAEGRSTRKVEKIARIDADRGGAAAESVA